MCRSVQRGFHFEGGPFVTTAGGFRGVFAREKEKVPRGVAALGYSGIECSHLRKSEGPGGSFLESGKDRLSRVCLSGGGLLLFCKIPSSQDRGRDSTPPSPTPYLTLQPVPIPAGSDRLGWDFAGGEGDVPGAMIRSEVWI